MKFTVTKAAIEQELQLADSVIDRKKTIEILQYMLVEAVDGCVRIAVTSLENWFLTSCEAEVTKPGKAVLPIAQLYRMVSDLADGAIEFEVKGRAVTVSIGNACAKFPTMEPGDFPEPPIITGAAIELSARVVEQMVRRVRHAVRIDGRYWLQGARISAVNQKFSCVATDGHRVSECEHAIPASDVAIGVTLPSKAMDCLVKILGNEADDATVQLSVHESWASWVAGPRVLHTRCLDGAFPNVAQSIPQDTPIVIGFDSEPLERALKRLLVVATKDHSSVRLAITKGEMVCSSETTVGSFREPIAADYDGEDVEIRLNPRYLIDALDSLAAPSIRLGIKTPKQAVTFRPVDTEDRRCTIMPINL